MVEIIKAIYWFLFPKKRKIEIDIEEQELISYLQDFPDTVYCIHTDKLECMWEMQIISEQVGMLLKK